MNGTKTVGGAISQQDELAIVSDFQIHHVDFECTYGIEVLGAKVGLLDGGGNGHSLTTLPNKESHE
jgi:hypothetical protein